MSVALFICYSFRATNKNNNIHVYNAIPRDNVNNQNTESKHIPTTPPINIEEAKQDEEVEQVNEDDSADVEGEIGEKKYEIPTLAMIEEYVADFDRELRIGFVSDWWDRSWLGEGKRYNSYLINSDLQKPCCELSNQMLLWRIQSN